MNRAETPIVLLCGGRAVSFVGAEHVPKGLVPIHGRPLFLHVLDRFAEAGFRRFVLATGGGYSAFADALGAEGGSPNGDTTSLRLGGHPCEVTSLATGADTSTAARIAKVRDHLVSAEHFGVHYSDVLSNVDVGAVADAHVAHGRLATLLGARIPTRFRVLGLRPNETRVRGFAARPVIMNDRIVGGYYFFRSAVLSSPHFDVAPGATLEEAVLDRLAAAGELEAYPFDGTWQYLDAERHVADLERLVESWGAR